MALTTAITTDLCIKTLTITGLKLKNLLDYTDYHKYLCVLNELDLNNDLTIITCFLHEIHRDGLYVCTINKQIESISTLIAEINDLLENIQKKINHHQTLYFSNWRSLDLSTETNRIILLRSQFKNRIDLLLNILKIKSS